MHFVDFSERTKCCLRVSGYAPITLWPSVAVYSLRPRPYIISITECCGYFPILISSQCIKAVINKAKRYLKVFQNRCSGLGHGREEVFNILFSSIYELYIFIYFDY